MIDCIKYVLLNAAIMINYVFICHKYFLLTGMFHELFYCLLSDILIYTGVMWVFVKMICVKSQLQKAYTYNVFVLFQFCMCLFSLLPVVEDYILKTLWGTAAPTTGQSEPHEIKNIILPF